MQPWMPENRQYAADMIARQMAQQALAQATAGQAASTANTTAMASLVAQLLPVTGQATVPALALGGSTTVVVQLASEVPNAAYEPLPVLYGAAGLLGALQLAGIVTKTSTSVSVLVRAPLLAVAAGATLRVIALRTAVT